MELCIIIADGRHFMAGMQAKASSCGHAVKAVHLIASHV